MAPLAQTADLEARLGRSLTAEESARADALLTDASALVRRYTRQTFDLVTDDTAVLSPVGTVARLPQRPVQQVTQVVALSGTSAVADITLPAGSWTFDGVDQVDIWPPDSGWILNLPEAWSDGWGGVNTYRITYDHGYAAVPDEVVATVCAMVLRTLLAPSMATGMVSERIGAYNYQLQQGAGSSGASVVMTAADRETLADYRQTASTIQLRAR